MKIAILTQPLRANYGGVLQNYALQKTLIALGHKPITLEKIEYHYINSYRLILELPKRIFTKYILRKRKYVFSEKEYNKLIVLLQNKLINFIRNHIYRQYVDSFDEIIINEYDAFIVGSDQIWRPQYNNGLLDKMFLSFIPKRSNVKRIAYAASFGTSEWEFSEEQTSLCQNLIKNFDAVSIRESDGVYLCKKYLNRNDAVNVLDPTLLLGKECYLKLCENIPSINDNLLFAYILDYNSDIKSHLENIAKEKGLNLHIVRAFNDCTLTVEQWLAMFRDTHTVITDSFHGTVFSIIFNKEFYSICNTNRGGSRFKSLLSQFNLLDRLYNDINSINLKSEQIDWDSVENTKFLLQKESIKFLTDNLNYNV